MSENQGDVRKYLFWGCAVIVLIPILAVLSIVVRTWIPLRVAGSAQSDLEERFGAPDTYAPPAHGGISPDRIEAFLEVRRSMMEICPRFEELEVALQQLNQGMSGADPQSGKEIVKVASTLFGALGDLTPLVGDFFRQRNDALIETEMGIGEYVYIFTIAYGPRLAGDEVKRALFADGRPFSPEAGAALRTMLTRQLEQLSSGGEAGDFRIDLEQELSALAQDPGRVPWQDGLPEPLLGGLAPYREQLDSLFCPETAGMATDPDPDRAMAIALD